MIIHNLDIGCITVYPLETHTPLVIDPNAPLTRASTVQTLQAIRWRHAQILKCLRPVEHS